MATQSASIVNLYDYTPYQGNSVIGTTNQALSLVRDSYSGKYYGSDSYDSVMESMKQAEAYFTDIISKAEAEAYSLEKQSLLEVPKPLVGGISNTTLSPYEEAKLGLQNLKSYSLDASSYVQKPEMLKSFTAHTDGWNKYFESAYKSPRLAEDNLALAQRQSQGNAPGNQLVSSNLAIRSESGTGVGRESVGLNPFGKLDAGLNI